MKKNIIIGLLLGSIFVSAHAQAQNNPQQTEKASATASGDSNETTTPKKKNNAPKQIDLETAYKREYAFLEAQRRELIDRLKNYQASASREEQALGSKIGVLERASVERSAKIDQLTSQLTESERKEAAVTERNDALETMFLQAESTLKNHAIEMPIELKDSKNRDLDKVGYFFTRALTLLSELSAIQTRPGHFYLENGKKTQGNIIHLGNIAAFGVSPEGKGSLVPAGGGDFKIWKTSGAETAAALDNDQQPDALQLYLFESRTNAVQETPEKTIKSVIDSGGPIGWVIVILGFIALLLIMARSYWLRSNSADTEYMTQQILQQLDADDLVVAKQQCEDGSSAIGRVLHYTLRHLKDDRDHMESIVYEAILQESGPLDRFGSAILVIASIAPLLGLLGTVTGMIETFDMITEFGTGDPKLLSEGIAIALVTTELGLIVAIPTLLLGSLLTSWSRSIKRDMEYSALRIINVFLGGSSTEQVMEKSSESSITLTPYPA
ncbi:biopolymer transport protein ExbB [Nitrosomonas sp. PY1]|uniref:MotA/TolQ/ExbB proton channel family protein n=1 Tax=Nitrosomonas sp. PY1 TaxID=1803906 RepID=UPI001FC8CF6A|nr:MotA/TolQ/ExbB proton channel family protein [Nitrosomonas sp. PY1]GKS69490.1 biopolymer transport protein ExbB [Nitrosomonas sp. PY1]